MARIFTKKEGSGKSSYLFLPILAALIFISGCYAGDVQSFRKNTQEEKVFSFYDYQSGSETHWKVYFKDNSISALYKNGRRLPDSETKNYSDMIYDKIEDIVDLRGDDDDHVMVYRFDDNFKKDMDHLKRELKKGKNEIKLRIHKDLKDDMKKLSIEMNKLKDKNFDIHINPENFRKEMRRHKELKRMYDDSSDVLIFKYDGKELEDELENLTEELKGFDIDIDIPKIDIDLNEIDENLKDLDIELKDLDKDLENLDNFFDELKSEMVKDKLIKHEQEEVTLRLEKDKMYVNDKEVPADTYKKYKELYKKHTGKDFEENHFFHFNND